MWPSSSRQSGSSSTASTRRPVSGADGRGLRRVAGRVRGLALLRRERRQGHREHRAAPRPLAERGHAAAVSDDDDPRQRQPQPERRLIARQRARLLPERLEHVRQEPGVDPGAGVADDERHLVGPVRRPDRDGAAGRGEPNRVRQQVAEHLLEAPRVTADDGGGIDDAVEVDPLAIHLRTHRLARLVERVLDAHRPRLDAERAAHDARHVDEVVEQLPLPERVATDDLERVADVGRQIAARLEHLRPAEDGVQRAAQLVRDGGEELVTPLRRLERGRAQAGELVDRLLQLADADGVFGGAAGWTGPGRFVGGRRRRRRGD